MKVTIRNKTLPIHEIISRKITEIIFNERELRVIKLIQLWFSGENEFVFHTSGSTGVPKETVLLREQLEYSARTTLTKLDPGGQFKNSLLCLDSQFIGGAMVVIRAIVGDLDLTVTAPSNNPFDEVQGRFDLVSMVPLQVQTVLDQKTDPLIHTLLIGGTGLPAIQERDMQKTDVRAFHTFGMTETASHFALKDLKKPGSHFETIGDLQLATDDRSCLRVKGTITRNQWIQTNDMVEIKGQSAFEWKGRADFIINTGGFKVNPEEIEKELEASIQAPFIISSEPDQRYGNKVILIIEGTRDPERTFSFDRLHPYARPRAVYFLPRLCYTGSGKVDRLATRNQLFQ